MELLREVVLTEEFNRADGVVVYTLAIPRVMMHGARFQEADVVLVSDCTMDSATLSDKLLVLGMLVRRIEAGSECVQREK